MRPSSDDNQGMPGPAAADTTNAGDKAAMASLQHAIADCKAARDSVFPHVSSADALPALHRAARSVSRLHDALTEADAPLA